MGSAQVPVRALPTRILLAGLLILGLGHGPVLSGEFGYSGFAAADVRVFPNDPQFAAQEEMTVSPSVFGELEFVYEWNDGADRATFLPFGRLVSNDDKRTHADIRELNWLHIGDGWDVVVGISRVFWGVAESRHLIDVINQIDAVEDIDAEDKLGQPMVNFNLLTDMGTVRFYVLPGFRERPFHDPDTRLSGSLPVAEDDAEFQSSSEERHIDFALRFTQTIGPIDIGLAHFHGTNREPRAVPRLEANGTIVLVPFYEQIDQTSFDVQAAIGELVLKAEALSREGQDERFFAAVAGGEYTIPELFGSEMSLGLLAEYLYDGRAEQVLLSDSAATVFDDDIFVGLRLTVNDVGGTLVLAGATVDRDRGSTALTLEASGRISDYWQIGVDGRGFVDVNRADPLKEVDDDDFVQVYLKRFF